MQFTFQNTTRIFFGEGQISTIAGEIPTDCKVLVVYGTGSIKKNGVYEQVCASLIGHEWGEFGGIEPNPQYDTLMQAVKLIKRDNYEFLLAVGGGSVIDGAKFLSVASQYQGEDPWDILKFGKLPDKALPISCVLTLPAASSESNIGSVISRGQEKLFFKDERVRPKFAILDPSTTLSLSEDQICNGIVDAYVHILEQYLTYPVDAKVQDRFSESLLQILLEEGQRVLKSNNNMDARSNLMWAISIAHNGLLGAGVPQDWTTHMIGHELTGNYGIAHARSLTIILPAVMKLRREQKKDKLIQYANRVFGLDTSNEQEAVEVAIQKTLAFFKFMKMPTSLTEIGLDGETVNTVLNSLAYHERLCLGEHGDIGIDECRLILELAK